MLHNANRNSSYIQRGFFPPPLFFLAEGEGGKEEHHQFVHLNKNSSNTELEVGSSFNPMKD